MFYNFQVISRQVNLFQTYCNSSYTNVNPTCFCINIRPSSGNTCYTQSTCK